MTLWIEKKYANLISNKLQRFVWKSDRLANFRCIYCGDSQKNKLKARAFLFELKNHLRFKCHNCGMSVGFSDFITHVDPNTARQYRFEEFKASNTHNKYEKNEIKEPSFKQTPFTFKKRLSLPSIEELPVQHFAKQYVLQRKIPKKFHSELYYADNWKSFIDEFVPDHGKELLVEKRLVIPFYDKDKNLILLQGRSLETNKQKMKYMSIKIDKDALKVFGMDRFDASKKGYVVEGPFDSMFLDNCIAMGGVNLSSINFENITVVFDNQPRNKEVCKTMKQTIDAGKHIFIWPENIEENMKDINDLILAGYTSSQIMYIIDNNSFQGLEATLRFNKWRKTSS